MGNILHEVLLFRVLPLSWGQDDVENVYLGDGIPSELGFD
jgi:hypothetical protein